MALLVVTALVVAGLAALHDVRTGLIPNTLTLGAIALAVVEQGATAFARGGAHAIPRAVAVTIAGAVVAAIVPVALWRAKALGGGDVKLFVALGALLGPLGGLEVELLSCACAALFMPLRLAWDGRLLETLGRTGVVFVNLFLPASRKRAVDEAAFTWFRFAPAIFAGTIWQIAARGLGS